MNGLPVTLAKLHWLPAVNGASGSIKFNISLHSLSLVKQAKAATQLSLTVVCYYILIRLSLIPFLLLISLTVCGQKADSTNSNYGRNNKLISKFEYYNGNVSRVTFYYKTGIVSKIYDILYQGNDTIQTIKTYTLNGTLLGSERTINGIKDGPNYVFFTNGSLRIKGQDRNGIRIKEEYFRKTGTLKKIVECDEKSKDCAVRLFDKKQKQKRSYNATFKGYGTVIHR